MRQRDIKVPKPHPKWGVLPSYRELDGGQRDCNREEGHNQREDGWERKNETMEHLAGLVQTT